MTVSAEGTACSQLRCCALKSLTPMATTSWQRPQDTRVAWAPNTLCRWSLDSYGCVRHSESRSQTVYPKDWCATDCMLIEIPWPSWVLLWLEECPSLSLWPSAAFRGRERAIPSSHQIKTLNVILKHNWQSSLYWIKVLCNFAKV